MNKHLRWLESRAKRLQPEEDWIKRLANEYETIFRQRWKYLATVATPEVASEMDNLNRRLESCPTKQLLDMLLESDFSKKLYEFLDTETRDRIYLWDDDPENPDFEVDPPEGWLAEHA